MTEKRNPNSNKYFEPEYGMTFNCKCPDCGTGTFQPENIHTMSEGHSYCTNQIHKDESKNIVGVVRGFLDDSIKKGIYCYKCDQKNFPEGRRKKDV